MAELITQFTDTCSRVEPEPDDVSNASEAHVEVRGVLEKDAVLKGYGIDTILIGSYARAVSIRRVKDVDVFTKLPDIPDTVTSPDLLDLFEEALSEYGDRVERQDRSIKVDFPDFDMHVDAVPARPEGDFWEIPDRPADANDSDPWQITNPEGLGDESTTMNDRFNGNYVPVVKLIRQTRRAQLGEARPGGLFFEVLTYHAFDEMEGARQDDNPARLYVGALQSIATQLADFRDGGDVADPSMDDAAISIRATDVEKANAAAVFEDVAKRAQGALDDADVCRAAKAFQDLLGKNADDEWVFELPSYCNADGSTKANKSSGSRTIPAGNAGFAVG